MAFPTVEQKREVERLRAEYGTEDRLEIRSIAGAYSNMRIAWFASITDNLRVIDIAPDGGQIHYTRAEL